jgi:hypothetical protein
VTRNGCESNWGIQKSSVGFERDARKRTFEVEVVIVEVEVLVEGDVV